MGLSAHSSIHWVRIRVQKKINYSSVPRGMYTVILTANSQRASAVPASVVYRTCVFGRLKWSSNELLGI